MAKSVQPAQDGVAAAIRLLTDAGYVVLKAPSWPLDIDVTLERPTPPEHREAEITAHAQRVVNSMERSEFMTLKEFCARYSISRSTAYVEIKAGRLQIRKIGRSTRISERAATEWLNDSNPDRKS